MFDAPHYPCVTMLANPDHEVATVGWNLLHDHRVSTPRFQEFERCAAAIPLLIADPLSLQDAVNQYCDRRVHLTFSPDFLSSSLNSKNFHGRHYPLPALHGNKLLVRLLNLGRLDPVFKRAKHDGVGVPLNHLLTSSPDCAKQYARTCRSIGMQPTTQTIMRNEQTFLAWIENDASAPDDLLAWLNFGFRRGPEQDEPYQQLFSALPEGGNRYPLIKRLAARVAAILERNPSLVIPFVNESEIPPHLVSRLLSLAALLDCYEVLAEPLFKVRAALLSAPRPLAQSVQVSLTEAILHNQTYRPELRQVWLRMTAGQADPLFGECPKLEWKASL